MSCEGDTARELRQSGRRFTPQRLRIAAALRHAGGHRSAEEICEVVRRQDPHAAIPLSTVYRTLSTLKEMRLVSELDAGDRAAFEWMDAERPHHHLRCRECGAEIDLGPASLDQLREQIRAETGFEPFLDHFSIVGRCERCRATATSRGRA